MKDFSALELIFYAAASALYWWLVYVAVILAPLFRCGLGPDSPNDCSAGLLPYIIGGLAIVIYGALVWLAVRHAKQG